MIDVIDELLRSGPIFFKRRPRSDHVGRLTTWIGAQTLDELKALADVQGVSLSRMAQRCVRAAWPIVSREEP